MSKKLEREYHYNEEDYEYMQSLSAAILHKHPKKISIVLLFWLLSIFAFILWASFTEIDELTRGGGEVVPYGENQVIQNFEGGIVDDILIKEGDLVKKGDILLKISNLKSRSNYLTNDIKIRELTARIYRLKAEIDNKKFIAPRSDDVELQKTIALERSLYYSNFDALNSKDHILREQYIQKQAEIKELNKRIKHLKKSLAYVNEEIKMTEPMVKEGIKSRVDFLKLQREYNNIEQDLDSAKSTIPKLKSSAREIDRKRKETKNNFKLDAKLQLNETTSELDRLMATDTALEDQVNRRSVRSLVDGIVQKLYVHTRGGVIKPGADLVEIVPLTDKLYLEVKISPKDIAFIHPGAEAMVKFSAYDFAIHGGLKGNVVRISPDTITDEKDETYYIIHIETDKNHLGSDESPLKIIPGMMVNVDIVTGQKTIMQYILKPIIKSKQYVFSER